MRLPQLQRPAVAAVLCGGYRPVLPTFALPTRPAIQPTTPTPAPSAGASGNGVVDGRRYASVKSQGAYRIPNKKTIAKKLGAKRSGDQFVIPGNIIFKQRGTIWHPGENALRGRDHTIHAAATGYVKYYRDPELHPHRQYIGVAFNRDDVLPYPKNEPRRRKLGMVTYTRRAPARGPRPELTESGLPRKVLRPGGLVDLEALEAARWSSDRKRKLAAEQRAATERNAALKEPRKEKAAKKAARLARKAREAELAAAAATGGSSSKTPAVPAATAPGGSAPQTTPLPKSSPAEVAAAKAAAAGGETVPTPIAKSKVDARASAAGSGSGSGSGPKKMPRLSRRKMVSPLAYLQKRWLERRKTKELILNPRNYAYVESNAAIGRLASRTMYTAPWKLGGRKARFRSRRHRREQRVAEIRETKAFVAREKERERIAEEQARQRKLEKQRARAAKKEPKKADKAEEGVKEGEAKEAEKPVKAKQPEEAKAPVEADKPVKADEPVEAKKPVEG